jgi:hypothetical protein
LTRVVFDGESVIMKKPRLVVSKVIIFVHCDIGTLDQGKLSGVMEKISFMRLGSILVSSKLWTVSDSLLRQKDGTFMVTRPVIIW